MSAPELLGPNCRAGKMSRETCKVLKAPASLPNSPPDSPARIFAVTPLCRRGQSARRAVETGVLGGKGSSSSIIHWEYPFRRLPRTPAPEAGDMCPVVTRFSHNRRRYSTHCTLFGLELGENWHVLGREMACSSRSET